MTVPADFDVQGHADRMLLGLRMIAESVELDTLIETISMAHTVGWFLDPTKYQDALHRGDMDAIAEIARGLQQPVRVFNEKLAPKLEAASPA